MKRSGSSSQVTAARAVRILLADDHEVVRHGVRSLLQEHEGWVVVAEARNGEEAIQRAVETKPDVAVLDYAMPILGGLEATRQIHIAVPSTEILIFTMHETPTVIRDVLLAGARGYVLKSDANTDLIAAVEALSTHKAFFTGASAEPLLQAYLQQEAQEATAPTGNLTPREREVVQLVANGSSSKDIARSLILSVKTVETHRATIMRKLHLASVADLVRYAIRRGLIKP